MFKENIKEIIQDLSSLETNKEKVMVKRIKNRLDTSLKSYLSDLNVSANYLELRKKERIIHSMSKFIGE